LRKRTDETSNRYLERGQEEGSDLGEESGLGDGSGPELELESEWNGGSG
jgi:hypothetical protein